MIQYPGIDLGPNLSKTDRKDENLELLYRSCWHERGTVEHVLSARNGM